MQLLKQLIPYKFKRNVKEQLGVPSMHWSLQNIKRLGFRPKAVLDIGAYHGEWTTDFLEVFPNTKVLMLEAQLQKEEMLRQVCAREKTVSYHLALLGEQAGLEVVFSQDETASYVDRTQTTGGKTRHTERLDDIVLKYGFTDADFLKLDVQGYELEVLKGGEQALSRASFCLLEVSLLDYGIGNPLLREVINFMDQRGFQTYDILKLMRRPYDKALDQLDVLFIRKDAKLISERRWQ